MCACGCVCVQKAKNTFPCKNLLATATTTHTQKTKQKQKTCLNWTVTLSRQDQIFTVTHARIYTINSCADRCQSSNYTLAKITSRADQWCQYPRAIIVWGSQMFCRDKHVFIVTNVLLCFSWQTRVWCDNRVVLSWQTCLSRRNKQSILLSQQKMFCRDKHVSINTAYIRNTHEKKKWKERKKEKEALSLKQNKLPVLFRNEPTHQRFPQSVQFQRNRFTNTRWAQSFRPSLKYEWQAMT